MTKEQTAERIKVMQAYVEGKKIQITNKGENEWYDFQSSSIPTWNFEEFDYRIAPERKYRPFNDADEAFQEAKKHGFWVNEKSSGYYHVITFIGSGLVYIGESEFEYEELLDKFTWADDGTPCGILEE